MHCPRPKRWLRYSNAWRQTLIGARKNLEMTAADILKIHQTLVKAVQDGRITESRLNEAVQRVLDLKTRYLAQTSPLMHQPLHAHIGIKRIAFLADQVSACSTCTAPDQPALIAFPGRVSVSREGLDAVIFDEGIASAIAEEKTAADKPLAGDRKLDRKGDQGRPTAGTQYPG